MQFAIQVGGGQVRHDQTGIDAIVEETQLAESLGFDVAFVPDHYVFESLGTLRTDTPTYEMFFVMTTLAQRTTRITIGSHVACMLFRHPAMHARLFAQLDEASGGRVIAGVGAGWTRAEFMMMGIDFPEVSERLRIMDEAVTVMRGLWRDEPFTFSGRHFQVKDAVCEPKPVQKPGPPLMLGGSGNGILRRAGAWADIIHMVPVIGAAGTTTMEEIRKFDDAGLPERLARVRAAEAKAGRPPGSVRFASTVFTFAPTDSASRTRELADGMANVFGLSPDALRRHPIALMGTPDEMIEELRRREREHGLSLLALNFSGVDQLRDFGTRVLPHVR
ncbi:MAG TPA: LLM class flavin-dependent oxidoreductase [Candidatus Binatia bacterium]|nr:LLM class flavin-dependent oxidoreductase [Candidatus Binatia bacterium]